MSFKVRMIAVGGVVWVMALLTARVGLAQVTIPVTDANLRAGLSPYNWICEKEFVSSSVCGASLSVGFKGTKQVSIRVDSPMMPRKDPVRIPVIAWTVNGGPVQTHQFGLEEKSFVLATGIENPVIELYIKGMSPSERRWDTDVPVNSLKILGFEVDAGAATTPVTMPEKIWLNIGDSIMSGDGAAAAKDSGRPKVWATTGDGRASYGYLLARHYGYREARLAFGGYNWGGGMAKVPALVTLIDQHTDKASRLSGDVLNPAPAVILVNLGTNGKPTEQQVSESLAKLRLRASADCKIILMIPFTGTGRAEITAAFNAYKTNSHDGRVYLVDLGPITFETIDHLHPTAAGHQAIFESAVKALDGIVR